MEKQKSWQLYLILAVLILTLYNILPTVFFYTKPLKSPVDAPRAEQIAGSIVGRVNALEEDSKEWLQSFSNLLKVKPTSIELSKENPELIEVAFSSQQQADTFRRFLPRAGALIPFAPAQLELLKDTGSDPTKVLVARQVKVHLNQSSKNELFQFTPKYSSDKQISPLYRNIVNDRVTQLAMAFGGPSKTATQMEMIADHPADDNYDNLIIAVAKEIVDIDSTLNKNGGKALSRFYGVLAQNDPSNQKDLVQKFLTRLDSLKQRLTKQRDSLAAEQKKLKEQGLSSSREQTQSLAMLDSQRSTLDKSRVLISKNIDAIKAFKKPLTAANVEATLNKGASDSNSQVIPLQGRNSLVEALVIDWDNNTINLKFYPDVSEMLNAEGKTEAIAYQKEKMTQLVINEIARVSRQTDESILPNEEGFGLSLNHLPDSQSFLVMNLGKLANDQTGQIQEQLTNNWSPTEGDLARDVYPIMDFASFEKLTPEEQKLGLIIYAPSTFDKTPLQGFRTGSIYVIARGLDTIAQKYQQAPNSDESATFFSDLNQLKELLQQNNFIGYSAASYGMAPEFAKDYIFELNDYYSTLLKATREDFSVKGSKRYAVLDFSDVEQRILTDNKIDDRIQEDLLKWKEAYNSAQVDLNATSKYLVPPPVQNPYWTNFKLNFKKYFRGDDRKILKWGLDLSGGKTVRIGLRDHNNRVVTDPDDLNQAVNELYTRINKMGVSERSIHIENNNIILDFPGSQGLSASELIKATAMYFHIVNEKFSTGNAMLKEAVNEFLQNVWNEAVVTNRKDIESINEIAWQQLGGESAEGQETRPRTEHAKLLWESGLRLGNPSDKNISSSFDDTISAVAMMRGDDFMEWDGQTNPLLFVFHNYALEGASLNNVMVGYDQTEGNILSFGVKRSYEGSHDKRSGSPRDDFYAWTSRFAEDKIAGTPNEIYTNGRGWRMAVVLNGSVISKPSLRAALRDGGMISGRFSQREVNQLAADLKAGSLSFTPKILSEQNVSPELGQQERTKGIVASLVAVVLVVIAMVAYYHFAGVVASCAVLLNILIMWAVLQNIDAAISLPMIAGIVLTIGMAVDANVLVFERVREEFAISGRIASAIQTGYRKAFSAIADSNITTIIAAVILIQFDSGPIKGFAIALIIGIVSSMFTALFMTRYFFAGWVKNPKNKNLTMSQFIGKTQFDFLSQTKKAVVISLLVMIVGTFLFISQRNTMLGMDFTGGYALVVDIEGKQGVQEDTEINYRNDVANALLSNGATSNDFQIRELSRPNQLRVQLGVSMEEKGHPFYQMPAELTESKFAYSYQSNPRLVWLVNALQDQGLVIEPMQLENLDKDWTVMSGQFSETMRNNALFGLALALICILFYITLRFEFKFALGAVIGLVHDVVITLGILALFHWLGFAVQIDLQVIGAIMTIIGYSLNDTIIVFDRIREDMKVLRKLKFNDIVNHALNVTLSRTIMTSGTTLLVLLALVLLGGKSIFAFSLVMTIGVIVGTLSSLFIAAPVLIFLHNREIEQKHGSAGYKKA